MLRQAKTNLSPAVWIGGGAPSSAVLLTKMIGTEHSKFALPSITLVYKSYMNRAIP